MAITRGADEQKAERLGYLGLGMMGFPMTRRLVDAGYDVTVWNRSSGKAAAPRFSSSGFGLVAPGAAAKSRVANAAMPDCNNERRVNMPNGRAVAACTTDRGRASHVRGAGQGAPGSADRWAAGRGRPMNGTSLAPTPPLTTDHRERSEPNASR